jgi:hypothetical protein
MVISGYFIGGYFRLNYQQLLMVIRGYFINGYY